ncbi:MAG: hypothetical protein ACTSQX_09970 [Candidatus Heimdallarchaeota archaeon]
MKNKFKIRLLFLFIVVVFVSCSFTSQVDAAAKSFILTNPNKTDETDESVQVGTNPETHFIVSSNNLDNSETVFTKQASNESLYIWENDSIIDADFDYALDLEIIIDSEFTIHLFIAGELNDNYGLYHMYKVNGSDIWSTPFMIDVIDDDQYETLFDVKVDTIGNVHLVYNRFGSIFYMKFNGLSWNEQLYFQNGNSARLQLDSNGNPKILYYQSVGRYRYPFAQYYYLEELQTNSTWTTFQFTTDFNRPSISFDFSISYRDNKEIIDIFLNRQDEIEDDYGTSLYFEQKIYHISKTNISDDVSELNLLSTYQFPFSGLYSYKESLMIGDGVDTLHSFVDIPADTENQIYYQQKSGSSWSPSTIISQVQSTNPNMRVYFDAAMEPLKQIAFLWVHHEIINGSITEGQLKLKTYHESVGWSETDILHSNRTIAYSPSLSFDPFGDVHMVWFEMQDNLRKIKYRFGYGDADLDGLSNQDEVKIYGTDPLNPDTDGDQFLDGEEIALGFDPFNPDEDNDLMGDGWEYHNGLDPYTNDSYLDLDLDLLLNIEEFLANTLPDNNDSDSDNLDDYQEVKIYFTDPLNEDSDNDKIDDGIEVNDLGSNPISNDTDIDGMNDYYEWIWGLQILVNDSYDDPDLDGLVNILEYEHGIKPNDPDTDDDLLNDYDEVIVYFSHPINLDTDSDSIWDGIEVHTYNTSPILRDTDFDSLDDDDEIFVTFTNATNPDTDGDLMVDGYEWQYGLDPLNGTDYPYDFDLDGLTNLEESVYWSDPFDDDTDDDLLLDPHEVQIGTNPILADTDSDGLDDYLEIVVILSNATNGDTDYDFLGDYLEYHIYFTNILLNDSDLDGLIDGLEVYIYFTDPLNDDSDFEGLLDGEEVLLGTNPLNSDSENDGMDDFWEVIHTLNPLIDDSLEDLDLDNVTNIIEYQYKANPMINDTDHDGLNDYLEIMVYYTLAYSNDTDQDSLTDYEEIETYKTNPHDPDTDDDYLLDGYEVAIGTDPKSADTDHDGVPDGEEIADGTDPLNPYDNKSDNISRIILILGIAGVSFLVLYYTIPLFFRNRISAFREKFDEEEK